MGAFRPHGGVRARVPLLDTEGVISSSFRLGAGDFWAGLATDRKGRVERAAWGYFKN